MLQTTIHAVIKTVSFVLNLIIIIIIIIVSDAIVCRRVNDEPWEHAVTCSTFDVYT